MVEVKSLADAGGRAGALSRAAEAVDCTLNHQTTTKVDPYLSHLSPLLC